MIEQFVQSPGAFLVSDSGDPYRRLRVLARSELADWEHARRSQLLNEPRLVSITDGPELTGFAVTRALPVDSASLGCSIASIDVIGVRTGSSEAITDRLARLLALVRQNERHSSELLTALVDLDQSAVLYALQAAGASVLGANSTWVSSLGEGYDVEEPPPSAVETAEVLEAVRAAFSSYRSHYHADPRFAGKDPASTYVDTVRQHLDEGGECLVVRDSEGITAFATVVAHEALNRLLERPVMAEIGIAGVVPRARGRGELHVVLGRALTALRERGTKHVSYGSAADNFAAQTALIALRDFRPRRFCFRLHWWLES